MPLLHDCINHVSRPHVYIVNSGTLVFAVKDFGTLRTSSTLYFAVKDFGTLRTSATLFFCKEDFGTLFFAVKDFRTTV